MDSLDDIKWAVKNPSDFIIAFFHNQEDAKSFHEGQPDGYELLSRDDNDFYIDIRVDTSSCFEVR